MRCALGSLPRLFAVCIASFFAPALAGAQEGGGIGDLRVGHWVEVKGRYQGGRRLVAGEIEVLPADDNWVLVGPVESVDYVRERFRLLGQVVHTSSKTEWQDLTLGDLEGIRVKVKGHHRGPKKFSARQISRTGKGRDRIEGRIDYIREDGDGLRLYIANLVVEVPPETEVVFPKGREVGLAPLDHSAPPPEERQYRDIDDRIPGTIRLTNSLTLGALVELKVDRQENFDLDDSKPRDRTDRQLSTSGQLRWAPNDRFGALLRGRFTAKRRTQEGNPDANTTDPDLSEAWFQARRIMGTPFEVQIGRQDFDEPREWIYDENLDAVRIAYDRPSWRAELSVSTTFADSSDRNKHSVNYIAYVSNNDFEKHLAAYVIDRRDDRSPRDYPIHFGARALGAWLPEHELWAEVSVLRGYSGGQNLEGWGFDLGTTWSPGWADPFNATVGWAVGSGDRDRADGTVKDFRQSGFQDNNGKFAGVTSFRYYGEIVDPELSNLSILTLGLGARPSRNVSLDLVWHAYHQVEPADTMRNVGFKKKPDGIHSSIGSELDLVIGARRWGGADFEIVAARFDPGSALPGADAAWLGAVQLRYRF